MSSSHPLTLTDGSMKPQLGMVMVHVHVIPCISAQRLRACGHQVKGIQWIKLNADNLVQPTNDRRVPDCAQHHLHNQTM